MKKDFIHITDLSTQEILDLLDLAKEIKTKKINKKDYKPFENCSLSMIIAKPEKTRVDTFMLITFPAVTANV